MPDGVVDACCTINVYAAGCARELLSSSGRAWHIPGAVVREAQFVRKPDPDDRAQLIPEPIDLRPLIAGGVLRPCDPAPGVEAALYVQLAVELDDGEAAALAVAQARGWALATDDRKARRLAG